MIYLLLELLRRLASVLIGDPAPAPRHHRALGQRTRPIVLTRIGLLLEHPAAMAPAIAEVKHKAELVARSELWATFSAPWSSPHQLRLELVAWNPDSPAISKLELVQVREIPTRERLIDRLRQLLEAMA